MLYSSSTDSAMSSRYLARVALLSGFLVNTAKWVAANPRTNPTRSRKDSMVSVSSRLLRHLHSPSNMVFDEASAAITSMSVCSCFAGLVPHHFPKEVARNGSFPAALA